MKKILSAALAATLAAGALVGGPVSARDRDHRHSAEKAMRKADKAEAKAERARWKAAERRYKAGLYRHPPGYVVREWRYGDRLPPAYYVPAYRLEYVRYELEPPPPGYVWTRVDDKAVLTAIATGVIASVVVGLFE